MAALDPIREPLRMSDGSLAGPVLFVDAPLRTGYVLAAAVRIESSDGAELAAGSALLKQGKQEGALRRMEWDPGKIPAVGAEHQIIIDRAIDLCLVQWARRKREAERKRERREHLGQILANARRRLLDVECEIAELEDSIRDLA